MGTRLSELPVLVPASARDAELARAGWTRRFVAAPPRLGEMVDLYESLGLEVILVPLAADDMAEECGDCALARAVFRIIYTRVKS